MTKKILKNKMEKDKSVPVQKEKIPTKKKKYVPKHPENSQLQIDSITQKIESMTLYDESQTQVAPLTPRTKSITKKKTLKKTPQKELKPQPKKEVKTIDDQNLLSEYKKFITSLCPLHSVNYHKESLKEKPISIQWYKKIRSMWKSQKDEKTENTKLMSKPGKQTIIKKTQKIMDVQNITVEFMKRLKPKHWLNDEVINSYIELIELDILKKNSQIKKDDFTIGLVKTYFAALKMTPERIEREIKKRALSEKSLLIIPINEDYHWFFLMIFDKKMFIFDSILSKPLKSEKDINLVKKVYSMKDSVRKCIKLYERLYKVEEMDLNQMIIIRQYPQQDNENDCGMMMLCGIKNVIVKFQKVKRQQGMKDLGQEMERKEFWNFCIQDIKYLRFMFGRELLEERLIMG